MGGGGLVLSKNWRTRVVLALLCSLVGLAYMACGGDGDGGADLPSNNNNNNNNNNNGDNNGGEDSGAKDAEAELDAAGDSGADSDASALPGAGCSIDEEQLTVKIDDRGSHTWDALQTDDTIHLAFEVPTCLNLPAQKAQHIEYLSFKSTGAFGEAQKIVNFGDGQCFFTRTPTLSVNGSGKPVIYHSGTNSGMADLYQKTVDGDTMVMTTDSDLEEHIAVTPFGPTDLVAFVNARALNGRPATGWPGQLVTMRPGQLPNEIVSGDLLQHIAGVSIAAFDSSNELGGVIAWIADVVDTGATPAMRARLLNKKGEATGKEILLTEKLGAFSTLDIAMLPAGSDDVLAGAVIYGVALTDLQTEQRFRTIAKDGTFGPERKITTGERNATGGTLAPFAGGYVAAFRQIAGGITKIVLSFLDISGQLAPAGELSFIEADTSGTGPKVFVTSDGRFSVVFANTNGDGTFLRAVRGTCDP
jgi:hypothetical protein